MVEIEQFFEDYEIGASRITAARTITETDICLLYTSDAADE